METREKKEGIRSTYPRRKYATCEAVLKRRTGRGPSGRICGKPCVVASVGKNVCYDHVRERRTKKQVRDKIIMNSFTRLSNRISLAKKLLDIPNITGREHAAIDVLLGKFDEYLFDEAKLNKKIKKKIKDYDDAAREEQEDIAHSAQQAN